MLWQILLLLMIQSYYYCCYYYVNRILEPEDYIAISNPVTFSSTGPTVMCRNVTIVNDQLSEGTQQFLADLDTSDPSVFLRPETATIDIEDNDGMYNTSS